MNWFKRLVIKWVREDWDNAKQTAISGSSLTVRESEGIDIEGIRFTVMPANGGYIMQTRHYDRKTDRHNFNTHLIHDGADIAEEIGRLVAFEIYRS